MTILHSSRISICALSLFVIACTPRDAAPPASDSATAVTPSTPVTIPTATRRGIGPYPVGATLAALDTNAPVTRRDTLQPECDYVQSALDELPLYLMIHRDTIVRIDVQSERIRTDRGIGIGDSERAVRQAYPGTTERPHKYVVGNYLSTPLEGGAGLVFATDSTGNVTSYRVGRPPYVEYVEGCS